MSRRALHFFCIRILFRAWLSCSPRDDGENLLHAQIPVQRSGSLLNLVSSPIAPKPFQHQFDSAKAAFARSARPAFGWGAVRIRPEMTLPNLSVLDENGAQVKWVYSIQILNINYNANLLFILHLKKNWTGSTKEVRRVHSSSNELEKINLAGIASLVRATPYQDLRFPENTSIGMPPRLRAR